MTPARTMCRYIAGSLSYAITITANAQCAPVWLPIGSGPVSGISATTLLPNDNLVVGGTFSVSVSGGVQASNIAQWDGDEWFAMGTGMGGTVYALTTLATGDVVAGGSFMTSDGVYTNRIARWDGSFWHPYIASNGSVGIDGTVRAVAALPSGDLIAGGLFQSAGGTSASNIARWDGTDWQPLGTGTDGDVRALTVLPSGDLIAAGTFFDVPARRIARWDGMSWHSLDTGVSGNGIPSAVIALAVHPSGDLLAGGVFTSAGTAQANRIARWDGTAWSALGTGFTGSNSSVTAIAVLPSGTIVAGGINITSGPVQFNQVAQWNGSDWHHMGLGLPFFPWSFSVLSSGDLICTGAGNPGIARWNYCAECYADCDGDGALDIFDFICFGNEYADNTPYADCDSNGFFDIFDHFCFSLAYAIGCS